LANSIRASPTAAGNAGGRTALSRNLLPGRQLDLRWADRRSRTNGPKAQSPRSSHQRYLRVPAGPRCPATPMRRARAVNKYGSNSQVIRGLVAQRVLGGPSRYQQGHSKLVPAGDVHRFSGQYVGVNALARHLHVIDHWLRQHLKKSGTAMLAVPVNSRATTYFLRKEVAAELRISPPRKSWR